MLAKFSTVFSLLLLYASNVHIEAKAHWSWDQQFGNPTKWNSINANGQHFASRPIVQHSLRQPMQQPNVGNYADGNFIQKPLEIIIDRPLPQVHFSQPRNIDYKHPLTTQHNTAHSIPQATNLPRPVQPQFDYPKFEEYLLHAQMPLPPATTFVMTNRAEETEPEFLT